MNFRFFKFLWKSFKITQGWPPDTPQSIPDHPKKIIYTYPFFFSSPILNVFWSIFNFWIFDLLKILRKSLQITQKWPPDTPQSIPDHPQKIRLLPVGLRPPGGPGGQNPKNKKRNGKCLLEMESGTETL